MNHVLKTLAYAGMGLLLAITPSMAARNGNNGRVTVNDATNYTTGSFPNTGQYLGYLGSFGSFCAGPGATQGKAGVDYTGAFSVLPSTFPNNTVFEWRWPSTAPYNIPACGLGIWAYNSVAFGNNGGGTYLQVTSKKVNQINQLVETYSLRFANNLNGWDAITDLFLSAGANTSDRIIEIEVFHHVNSSAISFLNGLTAMPNYTGVDGTVWRVGVSASGDNVSIMHSDNSDSAIGIMDLKHFFNYLIAQGKITGNEYYNGHQLGAEPITGPGKLVVDSFHVDYN